VAGQIPNDGGQYGRCDSLQFQNDVVHVAGPVSVLLLPLGYAQVVGHFQDLRRNGGLVVVAVAVVVACRLCSFLRIQFAFLLANDVVGDGRFSDGARIGIDQAVDETRNGGREALDAGSNDRRGHHVGRVVLLDVHVEGSLFGGIGGIAVVIVIVRGARSCSSLAILLWLPWCFCLRLRLCLLL